MITHKVIVKALAFTALFGLMGCQQQTFFGEKSNVSNKLALSAYNLSGIASVSDNQYSNAQPDNAKAGHIFSHLS